VRCFCCDLPARGLLSRRAHLQAWYVHGKGHRDRGLPAVILASGMLAWQQRGELHRDGDLPSFISADGQEWRFSCLNRERFCCRYIAWDKCVNKDGEGSVMAWFVNGKLHRDELPALIFVDGTRAWYREGQCCRVDMSLRPVFAHALVHPRAAPGPAVPPGCQEVAAVTNAAK